jgi:hypothetical protein
MIRLRDPDLYDAFVASCCLTGPERGPTPGRWLVWAWETYAGQRRIDLGGPLRLLKDPSTGQRYERGAVWLREHLAAHGHDAVNVHGLGRCRKGIALLPDIERIVVALDDYVVRARAHGDRFPCVCLECSRCRRRAYTEQELREYRRADRKLRAERADLDDAIASAFAAADDAPADRLPTCEPTR